MIKVDKLVLEKMKPDGGRIVRCKLYADTSLEVESCGKHGSNIIGLNDLDEMSLGSVCITADAEIGILNSAGNWNFQ